MKRLLMLLLAAASLTTAYSQNVSNAEYFFDTDPGCGKGSPIVISSPGTTVNFPANIPLNTLSEGFHLLSIRVRDVDGTWSFSNTKGFYIWSTTSNTGNIVAAEYFFDHDPGPGNATSIPVGTAGTAVNFTAMLPAVLAPGFHFVGIRTKDIDRKWGLLETRGFYVFSTTPDMPVITAAEYFFDNDPGTGKASPLTFTIASNTVTQTLLVPVPADLSATDHNLVIRVKDQGGNWSLFEARTISVGGALPTTCPANTIVNAAAGQCTAIVNNIDPVVPPGSSYTYSLSGATSGSGNGTASGKTFNPGVTTVSYTLNGSPTPSCSFTVTVNANLVPTVNITATATSICPGTSVTFTAMPTNGGTPTYQWKLNGNNVGTGSTYQSSSLQNGDQVSVAMASSLSCASPVTVNSNTITMSVGGAVTPSVGIVASDNSICSGTLVTFTPIPTNGGNPTYQWKLNGNTVGNGVTYQSSTLHNGDKVSVEMTSSLSCANTVPVNSETITITISETVTPAVSITATLTYICSSWPVTFTATPVHGGPTPHYQWKRNGNNVGNDSPTYESASWVDGDIMEVVMISSLECVSKATTNSNSIFMTVTANVTPTVTITTASTTFCPGTLVTFTATPTDGGTPSYQWKRNGNNVGIDYHTYQESSLSNGDVITCIMTSTLGCVTTPTATSNAITMTTSTAVVPSVSIQGSSTICAGTMATFTAIPVNGGSPSYQWKLNGTNVGTDSEMYNNNSLQDGDVVTVVMTSSLGCANPRTATATGITMTVSSSVPADVSIEATASRICNGTPVTFTATPINGGTPSYQWKLNGINVGNGNNTYTSNSIQDGDVVKVEMTSSLGCASPSIVTSNIITMAVYEGLTLYRDLDGDGFGNASSGTIVDCFDRRGYSVYDSDCDDNNIAIHPQATEICGNGIDDNCNGQSDENCNAGYPSLRVRTYHIKEGDTPETTLNVEVTFSSSVQQPASVSYATSDDEATAGSDYVATAGVLQIPAGSSSATFQLKIIGDKLKESNERFYINFSNPVNVLLSSGTSSRLMIIDDDKGRNDRAVTYMDKVPLEEEKLKIPTVARRNQVWLIPQIGKYENEVLIMNMQGQVLNRFVNYSNHSPLGNLSVGLYFYRIRVLDEKKQVKYYSGRLWVSE